MQRIDSFRESGQTDLLESYAMPIPATIIARMLGVPDSSVSDLLDWSHAMVKVYTMTQTHEEELQANQAAIEFTAFLQTLINRRRKHPESDLLSHLIEAEIDGESLTDHELISTAILLLNAGHEATVHQAGNAIKCILESGLDQQRFLIALNKRGRLLLKPCDLMHRFTCLHAMHLKTFQLKA